MEKLSKRSVPFFKHNLQEEDFLELQDTLKSVFLTTGPKTKRFEEQLASYLGAKHGIACTSWTTAAFLVLKAWGIGPGDEVIVPALTFIATPNIVLHCGAKPVFVDSEALTGNIDVEQIEKAITPDTKAIIPVHLYGQMVDMEKLSAIAKKHKLKVLEDCAHCIEGTRDGYRPGQKSDAACFSFYATKNITCGEGGAIVTSDSELNEKVRLLRLHGMSLSASDRYTSTYKHWDMLALGYKANLSDIQSALLIHQLERIDTVLKKKEELCQFYEKKLSAAGVPFPKVLPGSQSARHLFTFWAPRGKRDEMLTGLQEAGIGVAVNFRSVPTLKFYRERYGYGPGKFPVAEKIGEQTITVPMYVSLSQEDASYVADQIIALYKRLQPQPASSGELTASL